MYVVKKNKLNHYISTKYIYIYTIYIVICLNKLIKSYIQVEIIPRDFPASKLSGGTTSTYKRTPCVPHAEFCTS